MRAKPLVTCGLLAGVLTLPVPALALGLGKLTVNSGLGQPLSAQIELTAATRDELDSLRARIADVSVYRDNNVQFPSVLTRARVVLEQAPNGPSYLRVTTLQPVNDPFLDMIVELTWATGRVIRDYTFLLDPPGATEVQAVEPSPPIVAQATPSRESRTARRGSAAAPAAERPSVAGSSEPYTVQRGDTLSKIAKEYKPETVSLEQMLVALFRNNESAFDGKNMNRLRAGQILNIPPADQAASVTQAEAVQAVKVQAADWRAYRDRVAAAAPSTDTTAARQSAGGKIGTVVEDQAAATQAGKDQLRVSREAGKGAGAGAGQAEDIAAKDKALREANARVAELEKTVKDLQRAAELRNQTLAELQARAETSKGQAPEAPKVAAAPAQPVAQPTQAQPAQAAPSPAPAPAPAPAPEAKAPETKAPETKAPEAKAPEAPAPKVEAPAPKIEPAPAPAPVKAATKKPEPSFLDDLLGNTPTWAVGGGALVILAGIAGIIAARRRKTTKFEDSIISGTDIKTNTVFGSTGGGVVNTGDNSLASDFSREGLGSIDTDEVDPIAEAEVYLAYGRDAQAEEILKDALKKDSQRQEIYLKLLEIHAQHNKPSAFETVASELYSVSGGQGEVWQKAMALGRQLDPSNPLFAEAGGATAQAAAGAPSAQEAAATSDTQVFSVPPELKPEPQTASALDFSLDEEISLSPTSGAAEAKTPAAILAGAEEQVAKSSRSAGEAVKSAAAAAVAGAAALAKGTEEPAPVREAVSFEPESVPKFDLDFQLEEPQMPLPPTAKAAPAPKKPEPEPAMAVEGDSVPAPQLARPAAAIALDKLDLAFDPQRSTFEDPTPSVLDGQWHDAATKLDLAKAYQEMGDVEGAREILQEVLHEGDDQQKAEAKALLAKLA
ncbi:MAG TPA: FimV/HubP family polar landmark protein [Casimicrobiaceae bacterium]|nr:FimV/HubP family polar landmark protein [Casimicrobiaceae bacterium]